jgi:hypothetical protein
MLNLLKTIAFVSPAAVLAASLVYGIASPDGKPFPFQTETPEEEDTAADSTELQQATPEILHRMELKEEAISDFINGRMTIREAVDRFAIVGEIYQEYSGGNPEDRTTLLRQIRSYVEIRLHADPHRLKNLLDAIDLESAESP